VPNYLIKRIFRSGEIIYMKQKPEGYNFKPKNITKASISLEKIIVIKPAMIDRILTEKVEKQISKIVRLIMYILNTDDESTNPSDIILALNEVARLRSIILNRYQDYISKEKEDLLLKKLRVLENELRVKNLSYDEIYNSFGGPKR